GCAGWQFTTGVGPDGVPAALAFTTSAAAFTLVAVAGPSLETVARTVATSPAFRNSDPLLLATLTLLMLNLFTSMVNCSKSKSEVGISESSARNVMSKAPGESATVPESCPLAGASTIPAGRVPAVVLHEVAPMPPTAISLEGRSPLFAR